MAQRSVDILIRAHDEASQKFGQIGKSAGSLRGNLLSLGRSVAGAFGIGFGMYQLIDYTREATTAFLEYEDTVNKLRAAFRLAGVESAGAVQGMEKFANEIQGLTVYANDTILEVMALGASMAGLAGKPLKDATKAAIGLAAACGIDLETAMRLVAKAALGDTATLKKYGIVLNEGTSAGEKFNAVLAIGAEKFQLAEEAAKSTAGQIKQLRNELSDAQREFGEEFWTEIGTRLSALNKFRLEALSEQQDAMEDVRRYREGLPPVAEERAEAERKAKAQEEEAEQLRRMEEATRRWKLLGDPLAWVHDLPAKEIEAIAKAFDETPRTLEKADLEGETRRIGGFVGAMQKLLEEQVELQRQAAVAAGVFSETDAELDRLTESLNLTADEAAVFREELQKVADMKDQLAALGEYAVLPWVQWPERIMEDLEAETDAWLEKVNKGLGEAAAPEKAGRAAFMQERFLQRAPGQDPLVAAAQRAEKQRADQIKVQEEIRDVLADRSTVPWLEAGLTN